MNNVNVESSNDSQGNLVDSVVGYANEIDGVDLACLRGIISNVVQKLCPDGEFPSDETEKKQFQQAIRMLAPMQGHENLKSNGVCYFERPSFMTDEYLDTLIQEATDVRKRAIKQRGHLVGVGGKLGDKLATSTQLKDIVESYACAVNPTGVVSYMYYEDKGACLNAHVDTDVFSINVNIMLEHSGSQELLSHLYIFTTDGASKEIIRHKPGEIVITYGDSIVHGRAPLGDNENVTLLTIGFQPSQWDDAG